ncbi:internal alternative NAD(P)H-ubiquinone oxidoreductase A1 mitochondrial [Prunus yedoensis var. nudiflora]|uniref:Internal alternative NAD(P)H-ubiquinone oxidoreductase A1 mitochondrial n=1 Tax=Prunus yedoensis var. nudiflora TaxID=2094558 RepID=A0A314YT72_PRUYE|nr:internal alternative NAD(P)H-ubiquinone oxidoreductase A1 mitochondrial [Prunus yedoensis var. nudiflora]
MAWFRSLIQVSAAARSATKPRISDPFSYTLLSRFSSEPAPIHETPAPQPPTQYSGLAPRSPARSRGWWSWARVGPGAGS